MRIFLIGPGGAGKSTCGQLLAKKLDYNCLDLDEIFWNNPTHKDFIGRHGYAKYCHENSKLFFKLLSSQPGDSLYILSSGFLVHEGLSDLVNLHKKAIKTEISVLLLPSSSFSKCSEIIVSRQLNRGFKLDKDKEFKKIKNRFYKYQRLGDIKIYSSASPEIITHLIFSELQPYL